MPCSELELTVLLLTMLAVELASSQTPRCVFELNVLPVTVLFELEYRRMPSVVFELMVLLTTMLLFALKVSRMPLSANNNMVVSNTINSNTNCRAGECRSCRSNLRCHSQSLNCPRCRNE